MNPFTLNAALTGAVGLLRRPAPLALACAAGLALGACTGETVDPIEGAASTDSTESTVDRSAAVDTTAPPVVERSPVLDRDEPEPVSSDLAMVSEQMSEAAAEPPPIEEDPEVDDLGTVDVPQAELGAGESVVCATVQMIVDANGDGATDRARSQQAKLVDQVDSLTDEPLRALLDDAGFEAALARCEQLGYEL